MSKPSIPKGTRDFLPEQSLKRAYIFDTLRSVFQRYGYLPIETPAFETLNTLMDKYGEEGDRLIFKILNSGDFLSKLRKEQSDLYERNPAELGARITEKALRYDLTVPFARFVVQHRNDITFPFKRYQIQPVWRADRPQQGRYREFYQCDVDVVGSNALLNEIELVLIAQEGFSALGLPDVTIRMNNRKILAGLAEIIGEAEKLIPLTVALDKLDKIGEEGVLKELREKDISEEAIEQLKPLLNLQGSLEDRLATLKGIMADSEIGMTGIAELEEVFEGAQSMGVTNLALDVTLARGLNYYTGAIFEVGHPEFPSSICGGGRYDDLTGIFGMPGVSGVVISFGADRIYDLLLRKDLFPEGMGQALDLLFINFGQQEGRHCLKLLQSARQAGIQAELFPDSVRMNKQMKYADARGARFVAMVGTQEMEQGVIRLKDMQSGEQSEMSLEDLIDKVRKP